MNAVAVFLFVIGLVGFGETLTLAGPYPYTLKFEGFSTGDGESTAGGNPVLVFGYYGYETSTNPQTTLTYNSTSTNPAAGNLQHLCIFDWSGKVIDVYITHILLWSTNKTPTHVDMRGKTSASGKDGAGFDYDIQSVGPDTTIENKILTSAATFRLDIHVEPNNAFSEVVFYT